MKTITALLLLACSYSALAQSPMAPVQNFEYIHPFDYRSEVEQSDKYVVLVVSSPECLRQLPRRRECFLTERRIDSVFAARPSNKIKYVGMFQESGIPSLPSNLNVTRLPSVLLLKNGAVIERIERTSTPIDPVTRHRTLDLENGSWEGQFIKDFNDLIVKVETFYGHPSNY